MDRSQPNVAAIRLEIVPTTAINVTVTDLIDGRGAVRTDTHATGMLSNSSTIYSAVSPNWLGNITGWIFSTTQGEAISTSSRTNASASFYRPSNDSTIGQAWTIALPRGVSTVITKFVGIASSDGFTNPELTARNASLTAASTGFDALFTGSEAAWADLMNPDLIDDYSLPDGSLPDDENVVNLQIISKANAHYLLQNLLPSNLTNLNHWSISVGGLTSDSYAGLVFWDADLFMAPGIAISHPSYAMQIPNYRLELAPQAAQNAIDYGFSDKASIYPWTSGRWGNCTGTGPCVDYQYHINSDIFLNNLAFWRITGDDNWFKNNAIDVNEAIVQMYTELIKYNTTVGGYSVSNLTDPDGKDSLSDYLVVANIEQNTQVRSQMVRTPWQASQNCSSGKNRMLRISPSALV